MVENKKYERGEKNVIRISEKKKLNENKLFFALKRGGKGEKAKANFDSINFSFRSYS